MPDPFDMLLRLADRGDPPAIDHDAAQSWPAGAIDRFVAAGLLAPAEPSRFLTCRECSEQPIEQVVFLSARKRGGCCAFLPCSVCGPVPVPPDRLLRWQVNWERFLEAVFGAAIPLGGREELVPARLWRLGKGRWAGGSWNVYFARGLHRRDAPRVFGNVRFPHRAALFVPYHVPGDGPLAGLPPVVAIADAATWGGTAVEIDRDAVQAQLAPSVSDVEPRPIPKRSRRAPGIESLTEAVKEHLRAARDYAVSTRDRTGVPELLERPSQKLLAKQLGMSESLASRCFRDREAALLQHLWKAARDIEQVLAFRG